MHQNPSQRYFVTREQAPDGREFVAVKDTWHAVGSQQTVISIAALLPGCWTTGRDLCRALNSKPSL